MNIVKYSLIRLGLFAGFFALFYVLGMRSYMAVGAAIICGAMANYIFFPTTTRKAAESIEHMASTPRTKRASDTAEDAEIDDTDSERGPDEEK